MKPPESLSTGKYEKARWLEKLADKLYNVDEDVTYLRSQGYDDAAEILVEWGAALRADIHAIESGECDD